MKLLFALLLAAPPAWIFGHYADGENFFDLTRGKGEVVTVNGEVHGPADQLCFFGGDGTWKNGALVVPYDDIGGQCTFVIRFKDGKLITDDHTLECRRAALCGSRVGLDDWELPKIEGRYHKLDDDCAYEGDEIKCAPKKVENYIQIDREDDGRTHVKGELFFFGGHSCEIDGYGTWKDGALHVPHGDDCDLVLQFHDGVLTTEDPSGECKWALCDVRGGFHGVELTKDAARR